MLKPYLYKSCFKSFTLFSTTTSLTVFKINKQFVLLSIESFKKIYNNKRIVQFAITIKYSLY